MDAWETLTLHSSLPSGDAWEHLNNQLGGAGIDIHVDGLSFIADAATVALVAEDQQFNATVMSDQVTSAIDDEVLASVDTSGVSAEVISDDLMATISCAGLTTEGDVVTQKQASQAVGGFRFVTVDNNGHIFHASSADVAEAFQVLGITAHAGDVDDMVIIAVNGDELYEPTWTWDPTKPIYVGVDGVMTQAPQSAGFSLIGAIALSATTVRVDIKTPIFF